MMGYNEGNQKTTNLSKAFPEVLKVHMHKRFAGRLDISLKDEIPAHDNQELST